MKPHFFNNHERERESINIIRVRGWGQGQFELNRNKNPHLTLSSIDIRFQFSDPMAFIHTRASSGLMGTVKTVTDFVIIIIIHG